MQKTFLKMDTSGAWVEEKSNLWLNILIAVAVIAIAVIAVAATIASAGVSLTIILAAAGAVIKIGAGAAIAFYAVNTLHLGSDGVYLPEYQLTPDAIFRNEILAFDVNFFNPREPEISEITISNFTSDDASIDYTAYLYKSGSSDPINDISNGNVKFNEVTEEMIMDRIFNTTYNGKDLNYLKDKDPKIVYETYWNEGKQYIEAVIENTYVKNEDTGIYDGHYMTKKHYTIKCEDYKVEVDYKITYRHGWISPTEREDESATETTIVSRQDSPAFLLQPTIASWYLALRNIALVALLSILVYVGIRITLSSVASDKAKYKQMLVDWTVALALVFLMHYIMSFTVTINEKIVEAVSSIGLDSDGKTIEEFTKNKIDEIKTGESQDQASIDQNRKEYEVQDDIDQQAIHLFRIIDKKWVPKAYDVLVGSNDSENARLEKSGDYSRYRNRFQFDENNKDKPVALYWPAYDYMTQARMLGQGTIYDKEDMTSTDEKDVDTTQEAVIRSGYKIIYVVLVIYTVIFCFTYLKRVIYIAFLTLIAPLVAITYPIDKIGDGKAQAFSMWLKEYIFNLLIQPIHLILYTILVTSAIKFASKNIFYVVVALGFLVPAEKILRSFFGFEKAKTPGIFAGPAGAGLLMAGMNKLMHPRPPQGKIGGGNEEYDDEGDIRETSYAGEDPLNAFVLSEGDQNINVNAKNNIDNMANNSKEAKESQEYNVNNEINDNSKSTANLEKNIKKDRDKLDLSMQQDKNEVLRKLHEKQERNLRRMQRNNKFRRALKRGRDAYGQGIKRRYVMNKKLNGGILKRGIRMAGGLATAGTMAAAGGIIGIATGDMTKAAQYMGTAAIGGYALGRGGANKVTDKAEE